MIDADNEGKVMRTLVRFSALFSPRGARCIRCCAWRHPPCATWHPPQTSACPPCGMSTTAICQTAGIPPGRQQNSWRDTHFRNNFSTRNYFTMSGSALTETLADPLTFQQQKELTPSWPALCCPGNPKRTRGQGLQILTSCHMMMWQSGVR